MKKTYKILTQEGVDFAAFQRPIEQEHPSEVGSEVEIELSAEQEKAMIAAGWIEGPIESKSKTDTKKGG